MPHRSQGRLQVQSSSSPIPSECAASIMFSAARAQSCSLSASGEAKTRMKTGARTGSGLPVLPGSLHSRHLRDGRVLEHANEDLLGPLVILIDEFPVLDDNESPRLFIDGGRGIGACPDNFPDHLVGDVFVGILPYRSSPIDSIHDRVRERFVGFFRWSHCFTNTASFLDGYNHCQQYDKNQCAFFIHNPFILTDILRYPVSAQYTLSL